MLDVNNPIIPFPSLSLEKIEFKENKRSNLIAKINLIKIKRNHDHRRNVIITNDFMRIF